MKQQCIRFFPIILLSSMACKADMESVLKQCDEQYQRSKYQSAVNCYDRALAMQDSVDGRINYAEALLGDGDYLNGFREFDARLAKRASLQKPWHEGFNPAGKRVLVRCEQGLGDTFFFIRYIEQLKKAGATVIVLTQGPLKALVRTSCPHADMVINGKDPLPEFDADVYLMSLPRYFSGKGIMPTTLDTVPNKVPYMRADKTLAGMWKETIAHDTNLKIGICWRASKLPGGVLRQLERDVALQDLMKALSFKGVSLYNLQGDGHIPVSQNEYESLTQEGKLGNVDKDDVVLDGCKARLFVFDDKFDKEHGAFMDSAAVMANMDLIISVDTAIANLAGAMGLATYTLLPREADWRWMNDTDESAWLPNMILFRQHKQNDWSRALHRLSQNVQHLVNRRR